MAVDKKTRQKVHSPVTELEEQYEHAQHDLGPWIETPRSTRVSAFRYDYLNNAVQVTWRNNNNHGYIYLQVPYEGYRSFARAVSKGRYVPHLSGDYRLMTPDEVQAASNPERKALTSRVR